MPFLSSAQRDAIAAAKSSGDKLVETLQVGIEGNKAEQVKAETLDSAYSNQYYHFDEIIRQYDAERKAASGVYPLSYITENDFTEFTTTGLGTLKATHPDTRPARVPQFDGLPTATATSELSLHTKAVALETLLVSGFSDGIFLFSLLDPIAATSVGQTVTFRASTLLVLPTTSLAGKRLVFSQANGAGAVIVKVISNTSTSTLPPYVHNFTAEAVTVGSVIVGTSAGGGFAGFTNAVRTSEVATSNQQILNSLKAQYQQNLADRLSLVALQEQAVLLNQDTTPKPSFSAVKAELMAPLILSDSGLAQRLSQRNAREAAITSRVSQINQRLITLYQTRYDIAVLRADKTSGSLSKLKALIASSLALEDNLQKTKQQNESLKKIFPF